MQRTLAAKIIKRQNFTTLFAKLSMTIIAKGPLPCAVGRAKVIEAQFHREILLDYVPPT